MKNTSSGVNHLEPLVIISSCSLFLSISSTTSIVCFLFWQNAPQRHLIHVDAKAHAQLRQMDPTLRTIFLQRINKQQQAIYEQQLQVINGYILQRSHVRFSRYVYRLKFSQWMPLHVQKKNVRIQHIHNYIKTAKSYGLLTINPLAQPPSL